MLRRYGFDMLVDDRKSKPERINQALDKKFFLMPRLSGITARTDPQQILAEVEAYPHKDAAAFWQIGEGLGRKTRSPGADRGTEQGAGGHDGAAPASAGVLPAHDGEVEGELRCTREPRETSTPSASGPCSGLRAAAWGSSGVSPATAAADGTGESQGFVLGLDSHRGAADRHRQHLGRRCSAGLGSSPGQPRELRLMTYIALLPGIGGSVTQATRN